MIRHMKNDRWTPEFIARACNAYEPMLNALRDAEQQCRVYDGTPEFDEIAGVIRDAIAKAVQP
jgi:hypothetical protein